MVPLPAKAGLLRTAALNLRFGAVPQQFPFIFKATLVARKPG